MNARSYGRPMSYLFQLVFIPCLAVSSAIAQTADCCELDKEFINSNQNFSQAVSVTSGGIKTIYVSGQVGLRDGQVPVSFAEQVDAVFENMSRQLQAAGATLADVIKLTGFIVDIDADKVAQYSQARSRHFSALAPPPASTLLGISGLVRDSFLVEVEAVAVIDAN